MKYHVTAIAAACSIVALTCASPANANHGIRIDSGNGAGCMSTWTNTSDPSGAAAFVPGGSYANVVECTASGGPSVLFPDGVPANDSATAGGSAAYTAASGEMFQYYAGAIGIVPTAEVVLWSLPTGPLGASETEIELNGWCPGGSGSSFKFGGNSFSGGCGTASTDLLFSTSGSLVGYVTDGSDGNVTIHAGTSVPGWTESGGGGGTTTSAPEIDPAQALSGLLLLLGGLAVVRGGRKSLASA